MRPFLVLSENIEELAEKLGDLLDCQIDIAKGISGQTSADHAEAIYSLTCAYKELVTIGWPDA